MGATFGEVGMTGSVSEEFESLRSGYWSRMGRELGERVSYPRILEDGFDQELASPMLYSMFSKALRSFDDESSSIVALERS